MAEILQEETIQDQILLLLYVRQSARYRGWRPDLLVDKPQGVIEEKFLLCNSCRGVLRDACLYEKNGIQELRCSVCVPDDVKVQIAQLNREVVDKRHVYCPLKKKGCDWTNELSELLHHLEECELFPVACPLGCRDERGEMSRVERRGVETHRTCCPMRNVKCEYCSISVNACDMNEHLEVCEEFPIPCPNKCSEEFQVKRKDKSIHLSQECPLQETECPYSQYGCEAKVQRRNSEQHEKEDIHKHMKLTVNKVVKLEKVNDDLKINISKFQSLLIPMISSLGAKENIEFEWKINGIRDKLSQKKYIQYSEPFYVGFYKFQAKVLWVSSDNYVSLFLCIMKGEWDDTLKWPVRYKEYIVLINQLNAEDSYEWKTDITEEKLKKFPECFNKPSTERNSSFGLTNFISHADLLQEKFSKDDSITFKISVELISSP